MLSKSLSRVVFTTAVITVMMFVTGCNNLIVVPNLAGMLRVQAETTLSGLGLTLGDVATEHHPTVPLDAVISQDPLAGAKIKKNGAVNIVLSLGPQESEGEGEPEGEIEGELEGEAEGEIEGEVEGEPEGESEGEGEGEVEGEPGDTARILVPERAGVARDAEMVSFGMPLPRDWAVSNTSALRLTDAGGAPAPAQFEPMARWGAAPATAGAPVKWVLVTTPASVAALATGEMHLDHSGPGPLPVPSLNIDRSNPGRILVNTGAATFEILLGDDFNLINQVSMGGADLLAPLSATAALQYAAAGASDIVAGGAPDFSARATTAVTEREGPLQAVIRIMGSILDGTDRAILDFTARLHFDAGSAQVRVDFTVENNQPVMEGGSGEPANVHNQGAVNSVYIGSLRLNLRLASAASDLRVLTESGVSATNPAEALMLYQDSSGTDQWNAYVGNVGWPGSEAPAAPRLQSYCTLNGFRISGGGLAAPVTGRQALGWMSAFRNAATGPRVTVALRDFWENFPKSLSVSPDGVITADLFPNGAQFRHNLRVGEEKTHTLLLDFGTGPVSAADATATAQAFDKPLRPAPTPAWFVHTGALGEMPAASVGTWPLYERYVRTAFEPNPDFNPSVDDPSFGNSTLQNAITAYNFYGWQDYGDLPLDYEAFGPHQAGQMNLKYWYLQGMFMQFCRSGDQRWLDLALPGAWHVSDLDFLHIPDEGIGHWSHGAYFGHSQHDEPGNLNPNRNSNSPSVDLFFGIAELFLARNLTGEQRFADTALEGLQAMDRLCEFANFGDPYDWDSVLQRERANMIIAYTEGYRNTGDPHWLERLQAVAGPTVNLSNKGWVTDPDAYGAAHPGGYLRMFMFDQILWSLGRYLDFLQEFGMTDGLGAGAALTAYADFAINHAMIEYTTGRACHLYDIVFDGSDPSYQDINNWALVMADGLAYAHKYSGESRFMNAAAQFYATGVIDPQWEGDPPVYIDTKGLANALSWGLVYMNQSQP